MGEVREEEMIKLHYSLKHTRSKMIKLKYCFIPWLTLQLNMFEMRHLCLLFSKTLMYHSFMLKKRIGSDNKRLTNQDHLEIIIQNDQLNVNTFPF